MGGRGGGGGGRARAATRRGGGSSSGAGSLARAVAELTGSRRATEANYRSRATGYGYLDYDAMTPAQQSVTRAITLFSQGNVAAVRDIAAWAPGRGATRSDEVIATAAGSTTRGPLLVDNSRANYVEAGRVMRALASAPARGTRTIYRGMRLDLAAVDSLRSGATFSMGDVSSWTINPRLASGFGSVVFRAKATRGTYIGRVSALANEREWVMGGQVRVTRTRRRGGLLYVDVEAF